MSSIYPSGSIFECVRCHVAVVRYGAVLYEWNTGHIHDCATRMDTWVDLLASEALAGDRISTHILPEAVNQWLLAR